MLLEGKKIVIRKKIPGQVILIEVKANQPVTPDKLPNLTEKLKKKIKPWMYDEIIVISVNNGIPSFVLASLINSVRPACVVGIYDPRYYQSHGIVVKSYNPKFKEGDLIKIEKTKKVKIKL